MCYQQNGSEGYEEEPVLCRSPSFSGGLLTVFGIHWLVQASPPVSVFTFMWFSLCACLCPNFPFFMRIYVIGLRIPLQYDLICNLITSARTPQSLTNTFKNNVSSENQQLIQGVQNYLKIKWHSGLQNWETICFCYLSHSVYCSPSKQIQICSEVT